MTVTVFESDIERSYISSSAYHTLGWEAAADGTGSLSEGTLNDICVGQYAVTTTYFVRQGFLSFDTSDIPASAVVSSAVLSLYVDFDYSTYSDFVMQARAHTFEAAPLATTEYLSRAQAAAKTLVATLDTTGGVTEKAYADMVSNAAMLDAVNPGGLTQFVLVSDRVLAGNAPPLAAPTTNYEELRFESVGGMNPKLTVTYSLADPGPATLPVIPNMGGNGVDVLDATWELDRKGGFTAAALDIVPPKGIAKHETGLLEPVEIRDMLRGGGHLLWEGRIEEPARAARDAERETIECGGYVRYLEDEETFRLNYIDTDIGNWDTTQCTFFADRFDVQVVDDSGVPKLVMKAKEGVEIPNGANARAFYFPFNTKDGVAITDVTFRVTCVNIGAALRLALYTTSGEPGAEKTLIWSRTTDCAALDVSLGPADFPGGAHTLIFRIEQVGGDLTYLVSGTGDPETWGLHYGAEISRIKAYGSTLGTDVTASRVVRDLASTVADVDHRDVETSTLTVGQLLFAEPTTRRAAIEEVNQLLDWDYGMEDGQVFFYRKPWTPATVPDSALVVVSSADPCLSNWDVRLDWEAIYNSVTVRYQKANGRFAEVLKWDYEGPLGGPTPARSKFVDLSGSCDDATTAATIASRILADSLYPQPTGSVTLTGDCHLASGYAMPAIYIRPGMMVKNVDTGEGPLLITHVKGQLVKREIVLTIGTRDNRLSRWMARQEMKARPKAKKRRQK